MVWTAFIAVVFGVTASDLQQCSDGWVIELYLSLSLILFCIAIVCDIFLMQTSLLGTMTQPEQRKPLVDYLNLKFLLCALQSLCAIFGIIAITKDSEIPCENDFRDSTVTVAMVLIVAILQFAEWFVYGCGLFCLQTASSPGDSSGGRGASGASASHASASILTYDPDAPMHGVIGGSNAHPHPLTEEAVLTWENRCRSMVRIVRYCTCNIFGGNNVEEGFQQVARVLTTFFHHDGFLDVVASDIVAGIVLLRVEQRENRLKQGQGSYSIDGQGPRHHLGLETNSATQMGLLGTGHSGLDDTIAIDMDDDIEASGGKTRTVSHFDSLL
jgi:hypothetical protein